MDRTAGRASGPKREKTQEDHVEGLEASHVDYLIRQMEVKNWVGGKGVQGPDRRQPQRRQGEVGGGDARGWMPARDPCAPQRSQVPPPQGASFWPLHRCIMWRNARLAAGAAVRAGRGDPRRRRGHGWRARAAPQRWKPQSRRENV